MFITLAFIGLIVFYSITCHGVTAVKTFLYTNKSICSEKQHKNALKIVMS